MPNKTDPVEAAAAIVAAYVGNNALSAADLPGVIQSVYRGLVSLQSARPVSPEPLVPPVPVKKSVTPDYLISLEDGRRYRSLKRHLAVRGMTPHQYRTKWGLPPDYPMVAPNYSMARSELAKRLGLGKASGPSAGRKGQGSTRKPGR